MSFLNVRQVSRRYGLVAALDGVSLTASVGSRTAIVGPSGSGKTTLLRLIAGFEAPDSGSIMVGDKLVARGPDIVPAHLRGIGFVPQDGALFPHLTIAENIGFGLARDLPRRSGRIGELAEMVALDQQLLARHPHEISGGQQQRAALARALAQQPQLMLLDEPFSALDTGLRASTRKATADMLRGAGITTILVTHDQSEALSFADQVAVMRAGHLVQAGTPRDVYLRPSDPGVAAFLGDVILLDAQIKAGYATCLLGKVAVPDHLTLGRAQIMLRPEQVRLARGAVPSGLPLAQVQDLVFGGAVSHVTLALAGSAASLALRIASQNAPAAGETVGVEVRGQAHVFGQAAPGH